MTKETKEPKVKKVKRASTKIEGIDKNQSAYIVFCKEERARLKVEQPELKSKEIVQQAAALWKNLETTDPSRYQSLQQRAGVDRERYIKEKEEYYKLNPHLKPSAKKAASKKASKDASNAVLEVVDDDDNDEEEDGGVEESKEAPVEVVKTPVVEAPATVKKDRKVNKYLIYQKQERATIKNEHPEFSTKEVSAELSSRWKALSDEEKEKYV